MTELDRIAKHLSRRAVLALGITGWMTAEAAHAQGAQSAMRLKADGAERAMPARWLGYNTPANYDIPIEEPAFRDAVKALRPHYLRFPGGTVANYYQPETGQLDFGDFPNGSDYRKYLQKQAAPAARKLHPKGVTVEQYIDLCREMGAELVVVPNLETSSLASQAKWFKAMNAHGFIPRDVEMGNEFYLALLMDPVTLAIFPDWKTTLARTKAYTDAIRPYIAKDARIAVQSASSKLHVPYGDASTPRQVHEAQWDRDMAPAPWFEAVTSHLYPTIEGSAGPGSLKGLPGNAETVYPAFLARTDDGFDRSISATVAKMPGKEIWITEWGAFEPSSTLAGVPVTFDGMWLHMITRGLLAQLRHKEVTVSTHHALFAQGNLMSTFRRDGAPDQTGRANDLGGAGGSPAGGYSPINAAGVIAWFCEASRGPDAHYQRVAVQGSNRIAAASTVAGEGFRDLEAGMFRVGRARTLFVHNAWKTSVQLDISDLVGSDAQATTDLIETPNLLASLQRATPTPRAVTTASRLVAPPHSLLRIRWSA